MSFHVSRAARDRYALDEPLVNSAGAAEVTTVRDARLFARRVNERRDLVHQPELALRAGQVNAAALITGAQRDVLARYFEQHSSMKGDLLAEIGKAVGHRDLELVHLGLQYLQEFPPSDVYHARVSPDEKLQGTPMDALLDELLVLWLENQNPAFAPCQELFDDGALSRDTKYDQAIAALQLYFRGSEPLEDTEETLIDLLMGPIRAHPDSLAGQLSYIVHRWGRYLGSSFFRLLGGLDLIQEEEKPVFPGPGPARVVRYALEEGETEQFSPDHEWMPQLVLLARNAYVWLDQLSRQYGRPITRLDEVPDEELDLLASRGISGLWLIGLWERSRASREIKRRMGNEDAVSSAYSLYDYVVASDLGGPEAAHQLRVRAGARGIRLASDMVPNHMGIDSRWVFEHPHWFISSNESPFPGYSFDGPDLSTDSRAALYLEDHYYDRSDAAVVFKRTDRESGSQQFIYHGNDGTSMPWNDTAQLNYLLPEVREALIQTILHVARQFPVIRFDAAMTLAKKHFQRLWFPQPGTGGAIPSRSEYSMTREEFDAAMPREFWRDVVDRVAAEAPGTLLLAEAFWLMEGYFVRTLGMHRVYNSAFMNMLRDEENANYRLVIKNTLEFDPEILKRYVNFMNNPDEKTAVEQFGKDDRYFGICTLLATLPGLPMFGHGQVEGYAEKYGMEYRRAYWDERPDEHLVQRHTREIFPLLHRRSLFSGSANFRLYDLETPEGHVNEDVFAYSNRDADQRALIVYNNRFSTAKGWIRRSVAYRERGAADRPLVTCSLGEGLQIDGKDGNFCLLRELVSGLEYIRSSRELCERGLYVHLNAYGRQVFFDLLEFADDEHRHYKAVCDALGGRGVPSIQEAIRELQFHPLHHPITRIASAQLLGTLVDCWTGGAAPPEFPEGEFQQFGSELQKLSKSGVDLTAVTWDVSRLWASLPQLPRALESFDPTPVVLAHGEALEPGRAGSQGLGNHLRDACLAVGWIVLSGASEVVGGGPEAATLLVDELLLGTVLRRQFAAAGLDDAAAERVVRTIRVLLGEQQVIPTEETHLVVERWLRDDAARELLGVHRHGGVLWFKQEPMTELLSAWALLIALRSHADGSPVTRESFDVLRRIASASDASGFRVENLLASLSGQDSSSQA